ncbi:GFA family protein [Sphingomonas cavernae]|uniref:GFA family protein n=1 Tax=Sphingomonas cavernae TaxID=2320861 RepID=A0A418WKT9_9SPHN|nr:GFA family protein [Sphingomonas cavernae]RJF90656.1 GFA family protein [Sphingomonas cavernae]
MTTTLPVTGGCLCGAVRYTIDAEPIATRICWCRDCQHLAAGNATVNVIFPSDKIAITGETRGYESHADSGNVMHRRFCPACGTPLFSEAEVRPHLIIVRAGTLDDPEVARPSATIWTDSAPHWALIDETLPKIEGQPAPVTTRR